MLRTACIGDTVLLDGISKDLRNTWPDAKQVLFTGRDNSCVSSMLGEIDEVIVLQMNRPWAAAKKIYESGWFDLWLDFGQWARIDALLSLVARAHLKIGFKTSKQYRHYGYDICIEHRHDVHEIDNFRQMIKVAGVKPQAFPALQLITNLAEIPISFFPDISYVVFHMFPGGSRAEMKKWPLEHWLEVARFCLSEGWAVILTGGPDDFRAAQEFSDKLGRTAKVFNLAGRLSLEQLALLLAKSNFVVSIDTGVMHMASAIGAKLIAIHGPTSSLRWGPLSKEAQVIEPQNLSCSPCLHLGFEYNCPENYCLQNISSKAIIDLIKAEFSEG